MASFDSDIQATFNLEARQATQANFGVMLIAALSTSLGVGFTDRTRTYASAAEAQNDADLSSGLQDAITAFFSQPSHPASVKVGKLDALVAEITTITISAVAGGGDGETWYATALGQTVSYVQQAADDDAAVATGLAAAINAITGVAAPAPGAAIITCTGDNAGQPLNITVATAASAGAAAVVTGTPAVTVGDGLDAIVAADSDFYAVHVESRASWNIEQGAVWVEANDRLQLAQSSDADIIGSGSDDIASVLKAANYQNSVVLYHDDDTEWAAVAWGAFKLAADMDLRSTEWSNVTLTGITPLGLTALTTTQANAALGKNANLYQLERGSGSTGQGTVANGRYIDEVMAAHWASKRVAEAIAALIQRESNRNRKIPYSDQGIGAIAAKAGSVMDRGVAAGHFTLYTVIAPELKDVSSSDKAARRLSLSIEGTLAGAITKVIITGYLSL